MVDPQWENSRVQSGRGERKRRAPEWSEAKAQENLAEALKRFPRDLPGTPVPAGGAIEARLRKLAGGE
jgi:hypothetical protein